MEDYMWIIIAVVAAMLLLVILLIIVYRKPKEKNIPLDIDYLNKLLKSLGNTNNINEISIENKRIRLLLNDIKMVDANILKELEIPAFLKGKELKILIKNNTKEVYNFLNERSTKNE